MKRVTLIAAAIVLAVLAALTTRVAAQDTNTTERTFMTFSNTVEMPGVTLPAGTYVFRLADTPQRNVVQVLSRDEKDILGQWTFVQSERPRVSEDTVVMFRETREGSTPAVQYWYYPGERIGKEFIYPKDQAEKIAARTGVDVLTEEGRIKADARADAAAADSGLVAGLRTDSDVTTSTEADTTQREAPAPTQPTAAAGSLAGNRGVAATSDTDSDRAAVDTDVSTDRAQAPVGTSGSAAVQESTQARADELPATASPLPLAGLIGLLSLVGALGTRKFAAARD
jgi:hypothetical protein